MAGETTRDGSGDGLWWYARDGSEVNHGFNAPDLWPGQVS